MFVALCSIMLRKKRWTGDAVKLFSLFGVFPAVLLTPWFVFSEGINIPLWEKEFSITARAKAIQMTEKIDPSSHPPSKLAVDSGILIDKARLIDDESTSNVAVVYSDKTREESDLRAELSKLEEKLGRI